MITSAPKKEFELNFPIDKIKNAIETVVANRASGCLLRDRNNLLNTYRIAVVKNLMTGIMSVTLIDKGEKTLCSFEMFNTVGGTAKPATLVSLQDHFLSYMTSFLEGKWHLVVKAKEDKRKSDSGFLSKVLVTAIIISLIVMAVFIYNAKHQL